MGLLGGGCPVVRQEGRGRGHGSFQGRQILIHVAPLHGLETGLQVFARQFGHRRGFRFQGFHLLLHALEGGHGGIGAHAADGPFKLLLGLGRLDAGFQGVFPGFGLGDLALQFQQAALQGLHLSRLGFQLLPQGLGSVHVGFAPGQGFAGQLFIAPLEGQLGAAVPLVRLATGLAGLALNALLAGHGSGHRLAQLHQIRLHVHQGLVQNLGGIFRTAYQVVGIGAQQSPKS